MSTKNTQTIIVDLNLSTTSNTIKMKQYDKNSRAIEIILIDNGVIYNIPVGATVKFQATKPDGTTILDDCTVTNNIITYVAKEQLTNVAGTVECEVCIYEPNALGDTTLDEALHSTTFEIFVTKSAMDISAAVSSNEFNALTTMINEVESITENQDATIAPRLSTVETDLTTAKNNISSHGTRITATEGAISTLQTTVDGLSTPTGSDVSIADAGSYFTGANVEAILQEIGGGGFGGGSGTAVETTVTDTGNYYTGTNVETVLQEIGSTLDTIESSAATTATNVSLVDSGNYFTGTNMETVLQEVGLALDSVGTPATTATNVTIADAGSHFTGTTVEAALQELAQSGGGSATSVAISDAGGYFTGTNVETALQEVAASVANASSGLSNVKTFASVASMKAATTINAGDFIITQGYYSAKDGGNGTYIASATSGTDDGGEIHALQSGLYAYLIPFSDGINVRQFGAKGDGATNDTVVVQKAFDYCAANQRTVRITKGTYMIKPGHGCDSTVGARIGEGIEIANPLEVVIDNEAILKMITSAYEDPTLMIIRNTSWVRVKGGIWQGERATHTGGGEGGNAICISSCTDVHISEMYIKDCWGDGIAVYSSQGFNGVYYSERIYWHKIRVYNSYRNGGVVGGVNDMFITECEFSNTNGTAPQYGIDLEPDGLQPGSVRIHIQNCIFKDNVTGGICGAFMKYMTEVVIDGCSFINNPMGFCTLGDVSTPCYNVSIINNKFEVTNGGKIGGFANAKYALFENNFCTGVAGQNKEAYAVEIYAGSVDVIVRGNTFYNLAQGVNLYDNAQYVIIDGNTFDNNYTAITGSGTHLTITKNYFKATTGTPAISLTATDVKVEENTFESNVFSDIYGAYTTGTIVDNTFKTWDTGGNGWPSIVATTFEGLIVKNNSFFAGTSPRAIEATTAPTVASIVKDNYANSAVNTNPFYDIHANHIVGANELKGYTAAPTSGTWLKGQKITVDKPSAGGYEGYVCTVAGSPGTWKGFGLVQA